MIAFQRQLNLRNRNVIISKPQKKADENKDSTSGADKNTDDKKENEKSGNGKQINVNKPVANKEPRKEKISPQELPEQTMEKRKDLLLAETTIKPFSFEPEVAKIKMSLPFMEICRNTEYSDQLIKMLKSDDASMLSDTVNLQDDSPTILFGPRMEPNDDDEVPPFYVTIKIHDQNLHNSMFDTGASHNLMAK